jgi:hypothetical protein
MPAQAIAQRPESKLVALAVIVQDMAVVAGRPDEVEPDAVAPSVRRTFEAGLEEAGEALAETIAHQCS